MPADGAPRLLELELTEPSLFLGHWAGAVDRLAAALARQLRRPRTTRRFAPRTRGR